MNSNTPQPSREDIEIRLTALLLGELPPAEAELLRWNISQDAELATLHDRLRSTMGLVREVVANPEEATVKTGAPLKMSEERREKLLAHFKTVAPREFAAAPVNPQKKSWLFPYRMNRIAGRTAKSRRKMAWLVQLAALLVVVALLAEMCLPRLAAAKRGEYGASSWWNPFAMVNSLSGDKEEMADSAPPASSQPAATLAMENGPIPVTDQDKSKSATPPASGNIVLPTSSPVAYSLFNPLSMPPSPAAPTASLPVNSTVAAGGLVTHGAGGAGGGFGGGGAGGTARSWQYAGNLNSTVSRAPLEANASPALPVVAEPAQPLPSTPAQKLGDNSGGGRTGGGRNVTASLNGFYDDNVRSPRGESSTSPTAGERGITGNGLKDDGVAVAEIPNSSSAIVLPPASGGNQDAVSAGATYDFRAGARTTATYDNSGTLADVDKKLDQNGSNRHTVDRQQREQQVENSWMPPVEVIGKASSGTVAVQKLMPLQNRQLANGLTTSTIVDSPVPLGQFPPPASVPAMPGQPPATSPVENLQASLSESTIEIQAAQSNVDHLRSTLHIVDNNPVSVAPQLGLESGQLYWVAKRHLEELEASNQVLAAKLKLESLDQGALSPPVDIPVPQPEVSTKANAFSTFSLNVSDVSFKLAAASLEHNILPQPASIRSEEFINAFDYRDPEPPAGAPVDFAWERAGDPFAHNRDFLRFSIKTAAEGRAPGRPLNVVLLLDKSGSMERADRVAIIREALRVLATQLGPNDTLSVITFARTARLYIDGARGDQAQEVFDKLSGITPQGGTNLEEAMNLAYQTALRHYLEGGVNRVVLMTDGAANLGNVDPQQFKQKVETNRKQGIAIDCFGIGWEDYNDNLLEMMASHGDGRYGFLNTPEEASSGFATQLAGALKVAAADVKVQVEFNPARVTAYRQIGYATHQLTKQQFRDNTVDAAVIGAAESGNGLYTVQINPQGEGPVATVRVRFRTPETSDVQEHSWIVPYTGTAVALDQASPAMRLTTVAGTFAESLMSSPYAAGVTPDELVRYLNGIPEVYGTDPRPKQLEWMLRQAKGAAVQSPPGTGQPRAGGGF